MSRSLDYADTPCPDSPFGRRMYRRGRSLIEDAGARLSNIVWDADETLWNWLMPAGDLTDHVFGFATGRDSAHREFYRLKPGMFEMIWGMHHASRRHNLDPHMRIWTDGYPWRLGRIAREIPGFAELLGPPADTSAGTHRGFERHPRIFYRKDFADVVRQLVSGESGAIERLGALAPRARSVLQRHFERTPLDSTLKLPELARPTEKSGFSDADILVDDRRTNVERFVDSGRRGIHVVSEIPGIVMDRIPNTVWRAPRRKLEQLEDCIAPGVADHLATLADHEPSTSRTVHPRPETPDHPPTDFTIAIPGDVLRRQWWAPIRDLEATLEQ